MKSSRDANMAMRKCVICGGEFFSCHNNEIACSPVCKRENAARTRAKYRAEHLEEERARKALYRAKDPEKAKEVGRRAAAKKAAELQYYKNLVAELTAALSAKESKS